MGYLMKRKNRLKLKSKNCKPKILYSHSNINWIRSYWFIEWKSIRISNLRKTIVSRHSKIWIVSLTKRSKIPLIKLKPRNKCLQRILLLLEKASKPETIKPNLRPIFKSMWWITVSLLKWTRAQKFAIKKNARKDSTRRFNNSASLLLFIQERWHMTYIETRTFYLRPHLTSLVTKLISGG